MNVGELIAQIRQTPVATNGGGGKLSIEDPEVLGAIAKGLVNYLRNRFAPELMGKFIQPELDALNARILAVEQRPDGRIRAKGRRIGNPVAGHRGGVGRVNCLPAVRQRTHGVYR